MFNIVKWLGQVSNSKQTKLKIHYATEIFLPKVNCLAKFSLFNFFSNTNKQNSHEKIN